MLKFSTYEQAFDELLENEGLKKKAAKSGISYGTLKKVYNRGMAAWRTGHRPGTTPQQWGMARVNSYIGKGKGTYYGADADLRGEKRKTKKEALDDKDKSTVKDVIKGLKKAVNIHKSQAATLTKDIKDNVNEAYESVNEKLDHAALKRDFNEYKKGSGKVHTITKTHTIKNAHIMGKHSFDTKKGKVPVLKRYDRKQFTRGPVTIKKGTHVVIDKDEAYAHGYHPDAGHFRFIHHSDPDIKNDHDKFHKPGVHKIKEATVKEISKGLAKRYVGKAARDVYFKGRSQATKDAISQLGGPDTDYKKSPERKAAMRMRGIDRATKRLAKNEDKVSDAERKAMDAFMKKGKMKKLPPGKAAGYHGKSDPSMGMKGMMDKGDTKAMGTRKKIGSMK